MVTASSPRVVPPTVRENIQTSNTTASPRCLAVTQTLKWSDVAELLPGRLGKQCRERWFNHLDPSVKKTPWSPREDEILFNAQVFGGCIVFKHFTDFLVSSMLTTKTGGL